MVGIGGSSSGDGKFDPIGKSSRVFQEAHEKSDVDDGDEASHHTLGLGRYQAAPGPALGRANKAISVVKQAVEILVDKADGEVGEVRISFSDNPPPHFLNMKGQLLLKSQFPALWSYLQSEFGTLYNYDTTRFIVPDVRDRFIVGPRWTNGAVDGVGAGEGDPYEAAMRWSIVAQHPHKHPFVHNHSFNNAVTGSTATAGSHTHNIGNNIGTVTRAAGEVGAAGPNHNHNANSSGGHSHTFSGNINGTTGNTPADLLTNWQDSLDFGPAHPFLRVQLIIRYESEFTGSSMITLLQQLEELVNGEE
jgi:microcystin-dependent protein